MDPDNLHFQNTLAAAQYRAGNFAESLRVLERVEKENADKKLNFDWLPHNWLVQALCHAKLGQRDAAQAAYEKAREPLKRANENSVNWHEAQFLNEDVKTLLGIKPQDD